MKVLFFITLLLLTVWGEGLAEEKGETEGRILAVFYPYRQGPPQALGLASGLTVDRTNWQAAETLLPPELLKLIQVGDLTFTVQETTDIPVREEHIAATLEHYGRVELGGGELKNYVAGLPFPLIDPQDPRAGEKVMWNHRYHDRADTIQTWPTMVLLTGSGAVERSVQFHSVFLYGMHRSKDENNLEKWEREGIYFKLLNEFLAPLDIEGNMLITHRHDKDTTADEQWAYDTRSRRVRKVVANLQEAMLGLNAISEDRWGFIGYIHPYRWKFLGEKVVLAPGIIHASRPTLGGKGGWYPIDPWELRIALMVECLSSGSHPYGRRVFYIDKQTYEILYVLIFDHEGNHYRTLLLCYAHPDFSPWNKGQSVPINTGQIYVDHRAGRAAVYVSEKTIYNQPVSPKAFNVRALLQRGK